VVESAHQWEVVRFDPVQARHTSTPAGLKIRRLLRRGSGRWSGEENKSWELIVETPHNTVSEGDLKPALCKLQSVSGRSLFAQQASVKPVW